MTTGLLERRPLGHLSLRGWFGVLTYNEADIYQIPPYLLPVLEDELYRIACCAFRRNPTADFEDDVRKHLRDGVLYAADYKGEWAGFAVMKDFEEINATYIAGIAKIGGPSGLIQAIIDYHVSQFDIVTTRTQNDRVVEIMLEICRTVIPVHRQTERRELDILTHMGLDRSNNGLPVELDLIARGHYGHPMIADGIRRRSINPQIKSVTDGLNYYQGDAILLVGYR